MFCLFVVLKFSSNRLEKLGIELKPLVNEVSELSTIPRWLLCTNVNAIEFHSL